MANASNVAAVAAAWSAVFPDKSKPAAEDVNTVGAAGVRPGCVIRARGNLQIFEYGGPAVLPFSHHSQIAEARFHLEAGNRRLAAECCGCDESVVCAFVRDHMMASGLPVLKDTTVGSLSELHRTRTRSGKKTPIPGPIVAGEKTYADGDEVPSKYGGPLLLGNTLLHESLVVCHTEAQLCAFTASMQCDGKPSPENCSYLKVPALANGTLTYGAFQLHDGHSVKEEGRTTTAHSTVATVLVERLRCSVKRGIALGGGAPCVREVYAELLKHPGGFQLAVESALGLLFEDVRIGDADDCFDLQELLVALNVAKHYSSTPKCWIPRLERLFLHLQASDKYVKKTDARSVNIRDMEALTMLKSGFGNLLQWSLQDASTVREYAKTIAHTGRVRYEQATERVPRVPMPLRVGAGRRAFPNLPSLVQAASPYRPTLDMEDPRDLHLAIFEELLDMDNFNIRDYLSGEWRKCSKVSRNIGSDMPQGGEVRCSLDEMFSNDITEAQASGFSLGHASSPAAHVVPILHSLQDILVSGKTISHSGIHEVGEEPNPVLELERPAVDSTPAFSVFMLLFGVERTVGGGVDVYAGVDMRERTTGVLYKAGRDRRPYFSDALPSTSSKNVSLAKDIALPPPPLGMSWCETGPVSLAANFYMGEWEFMVHGKSKTWILNPIHHDDIVTPSITYAEIPDAYVVKLLEVLLYIREDGDILGTISRALDMAERRRKSRPLAAEDVFRRAEIPQHLWAELLYIFKAGTTSGSTRIPSYYKYRGYAWRLGIALEVCYPAAIVNNGWDSFEWDTSINDHMASLLGMMTRMTLGGAAYVSSQWSTRTEPKLSMTPKKHQRESSATFRQIREELRSRCTVDGSDTGTGKTLTFIHLVLWAIWTTGRGCVIVERNHKLALQVVDEIQRATDGIQLRIFLQVKDGTIRRKGKNHSTGCPSVTITTYERNAANPLPLGPALVVLDECIPIFRGETAQTAAIRRLTDSAVLGGHFVSASLTRDKRAIAKVTQWLTGEPGVRCCPGLLDSVMVAYSKVSREWISEHVHIELPPRARETYRIALGDCAAAKIVNHTEVLLSLRGILIDAFNDYHHIGVVIWGIVMRERKAGRRPLVYASSEAEALSVRNGNPSPHPNLLKN